MRKFAILLVMLFVGTWHPAFAQRRPVEWSKVQLKVQNLAPNLYMIQFMGPEGPGQIVGGNVGVFVGEDEIFIGDAGFATMAPRLDDAIKTISDKPVKYLINTHWHGDHAGGNIYFDKNTILITQDNARKRMEKGNVGNPNTTLGALPVVTFSNQLTLHLNGGDIEAIHFDHGHTDTDTVIIYPNAKVVQMGDLFGNVPGPKRFPGTGDSEADGTGGVQGMIAAADYVVNHAPDDVKIIPGHGNIASKADLAEFLAVLKGTTEAIQAGINQGKSLDQLKQEKVLAKWDYLGQGPTQDGYLERVYKQLAQKSPSAR